MLLGREAELNIYAPKGAKEAILLLLKLSGLRNTFPLIFHELTSTQSEIIFEDNKLIIKTIPLNHRVYTNGFLFCEKLGERILNINAVQELGIPICDFQNIKNGKDIEHNGLIISNEDLSFPPHPPKSYAFCSDTLYHPAIIPIIQGVNTLYHESTFLENNRELAEKTKHSTALQAAEIAKQAQAQRLILGHYSSRYANLSLFEKEAKTIFENTFIATDGKIFNF